MLPEFVHATKIKPIKLENPVGLQLVLIGSQGRINFRVNAPVEVGPGFRNHYFDIVNIEKYDVIIGSPYMHKHGLVLDFKHNCVQIGDTELPSGFRDTEVGTTCWESVTNTHHRKEVDRAQGAPPKASPQSIRADAGNSMIGVSATCQG